MSCNWKTILATVCGVITVRGLKDKGPVMSTVVFGLSHWESGKVDSGCCSVVFLVAEVVYFESKWVVQVQKALR